MANSEEAHALAGLTPEERRLAAGDEPQIETDPAPEPELRQEIHVPLRASVPENAGELLAQIEQQADALAAQFDEGDITAREYRNALDQIATEREKIEWQFKKADLAREMQETAERAGWDKEVADFMTKGPGAAIARSNAQMVAFDAIVRKVTADPQAQHLSDRAQLDRAWRLYQQDSARAGLEGLDVATSLGAMGGGSYDDGGQHTVLDQMAARGDVAGLEQALSKMTPEQRDRYGLAPPVGV
jgi:hypothetical protein